MRILKFLFEVVDLTIGRAPFPGWWREACRVTVLLSVVLLMHGCYYDVQEELNPVQTTDCDTSDISFTADILPILQSNCYTCHGEQIASGGVILEGYDNVIKVVNDGSLAGAVNHEPGYTPMPQDAAQLSDCNLLKINGWINHGAPNN